MTFPAVCLVVFGVLVIAMTCWAVYPLVELYLPRRVREPVSIGYINIEETRRQQRLALCAQGEILAALERDVFRPIEDVIREAEQAVEREMAPSPPELPVIVESHEHEHEWVDITTLNEANRYCVCARCPQHKVIRYEARP